MFHSKTGMTLVVGAIVGALVMMTGSALASIPGHGGVINGCYQTAGPKQGQLRVVDTDQGQTCKPGETALPWSQTGPRGPAGPAGISGYETVVGPEVTAPSQAQGGFGTSRAICPANKVAIGGGYVGTGNLQPLSSEPGPLVHEDPRDWIVTAVTNDSATGLFQATAVCALVTPGP